MPNDEQKEIHGKISGGVYTFNLETIENEPQKRCGLGCWQSSAVSMQLLVQEED